MQWAMWSWSMVCVVWIQLVSNIFSFIFAGNYHDKRHSNKPFRIFNWLHIKWLLWIAILKHRVVLVLIRFPRRKSDAFILGDDRKFLAASRWCDTRAFVILSIVFDHPSVECAKQLNFICSFQLILVLCVLAIVFSISCDVRWHFTSQLSYVCLCVCHFYERARVCVFFVNSHYLNFDFLWKSLEIEAYKNTLANPY